MSKVCQSCEKPVHAKGLCNFHYIAIKQLTAPQCSEAECDRPSRARGMCHKHYDRVLRSESLDDIDYEDFWRFVKKELKIA